MTRQLLVTLAVLVSQFPSLHANEAHLLQCGHCAMMARLQARQLAAEDKGKAPQNSYAPDRFVDVRHLKLEVTPDFKERSLTATAILDFQPIAKPLKQWRLNAVGLNIHEVTSPQAIQATQSSDKHLEITFVEPVAAGTRTQVTITYDVTPKRGLYFRTAEMGYPAGDTQLWTQGEPEDHQHWFPSHDYPNEKFTTEVICHVPEGMEALSNGRLLSHKKNEETGLVAFHWLQDKVHVNYLVTLLAGYFAKMEDQHGDLPVALYVPPSEKDQLANTFQDTIRILDYFEKEIGVPYPWDKYYNACAIDYMMGGMENTSLTTLTSRTLFTDATENLRSSRGLDAHEIAHQWFGDLVTCRDWSHLWLNEGFATYYSLLYDRELLGNDHFKHGLHGSARGIFNHDKDTTPMVHQGYSNPMQQFSFRAYPKGSWILHMLRSELGGELYRKCVKTYLERHQYKTAVTQDLVEIFEELSGRSLSQFFDQWVYLSGYPELKVQYSWDELTRQAKLSISQVQMTNEKRPFFRFNLPVKFVVGDKTELRTIEISREREDFYLTLGAAPGVVRFDPEVTVLAKVNFEPNEKMLLAQLADQSDVIGRLLAVQQLGKKKNKVALEHLGKVLREDPFFAVRQAAADGLAAMRTPESFTALQDALDQPDARVRQSVVSGLTKFYSDEAYNALKGIADREANPAIRAVAIGGIGAYARPELRPYLVGLLPANSYQNRLAGEAIAAMRKQDDAFYVEPLLRHLQKSEATFPSRGFAQALRTLAYLTRHEDNKDAVRDFLLGHVDHLKDSVATAAMGALGELRDSRAIPVLTTFVAADSESAHGKAAQSAIDQIRKNEAPGKAPAEVNRLRGQVQDLEKQLKGLSEELKTLQARFKESLPPPSDKKEETKDKKPAPAADKK
ncbi:MAG: M1 family aminopeptidase [Verrucomicrobiota bacterium]|nr:M1 family aminopeptidase [Verrucomicrobiota bacterium]